MYAFVQVNKQLHNNALNDHNLRYSKRMESLNRLSCSESLQRGLLFHRAAGGQRFYGFWSWSFNPEGYFCLLLGEKNQDDNSGWWWYLKGAENQPNHILGLNQQDYRNGEGVLLTHKLYRAKQNLYFLNTDSIHLCSINPFTNYLKIFFLWSLKTAICSRGFPAYLI